MYHFEALCENTLVPEALSRTAMGMAMRTAHTQDVRGGGTVVPLDASFIGPIKQSTKTATVFR